MPGRRSKLDLLGEILGQIIRPGGELFFEGNWRGVDRSRQQGGAQAADHGAAQNASEGIAAIDFVH